MAEYARRGAIPGGLKNNRSFCECDVEVSGGLAEEIVNLAHDPQTSGGLLIALPESDAKRLEQRYRKAYRLGRVLDRGDRAVRLV